VVRLKARSSKHQQCGIFDTIAQDQVQAAAGHDIGVAPEDAGRDILYLHDIEQTQFARKRRRASTLRDAMNIGPPVVLEEGRWDDGRGVGI
jgi:hypothetical protein